MDDDMAEEVFHAEIIETDINDLCRICGSTSDSPLIPIYDENGLAEDLASKIMLYLPIKVSEEDALPIKTCVNCTNGVLTWHLLYECCVDADRRFKAMFSEEQLIQPQPRKKSGKDKTYENTETSKPEENVNETNQVEEHEMEDVMFLKAEFGPEDEQYLEDETHLADGELEPKSDDQPVNVDNCDHHILFCHSCSSAIENDQEKIALHLEAAQSACDIRCSSCELSLSESTSIYKCEICEQNFPTRTEMTTHRSQHEDIYCNVCFRIFKNYASLMGHKKIHDESLTIYNCPICDCRSYRKYNVQLHIRVHVQDFVCRICCNSYNSEQMLENHKASHSKAELANYSETNAKVLCNECDESFDSKFKLYFHTIKEHNSEDEKFTCSECNRIFESLAMLRSHKKTHKEECVYYQCEECEKIFTKLKTYTEHRNTHSDSRPFQCDICLLRFKYSSNLSQHRIIHKGIKNFACHFCDKKFTRSNSLNVHLKSHRNQRNFACEHCNSTFIQSSTLYKHKRALHRKCDACGEIVGDRKQWRIHTWKECSAGNKSQTDQDIHQ